MQICCVLVTASARKDISFNCCIKEQFLIKIYIVTFNINAVILLFHRYIMYGYLVTLRGKILLYRYVIVCAISLV